MVEVWYAARVSGANDYPAGAADNRGNAKVRLGPQLIPWGEPTQPDRQAESHTAQQLIPWGEPANVWGEPARLAVIPWGEPDKLLIRIN